MRNSKNRALNSASDRNWQNVRWVMIVFVGGLFLVGYAGSLLTGWAKDAWVMQAPETPSLIQPAYQEVRIPVFTDEFGETHYLGDHDQ